MIINCNGLKLELEAPPSKSIYHRELIVNYIQGARGKYLDICDGDSVDVIATKECLKALEAARVGEDIILPCHESGSTLRFMIPVALALKGEGHRLVFEVEGRLIERPLKELADCLMTHGVTITKDPENSRVIVTGKLDAGTYTIDGSVSSQYISGLLMALSSMHEESVIEVTNSISSIHYIELTTDVLEKYGICITREGRFFNVPGSKRTLYGTEGNFTVEGDWSNGAFLLGLGSLIKGGSVKVAGLNIQSAQGDAAILGFMSDLGITIDNDENHNTISVENHSESKSVYEVKRDCNDTPDIVPYMAVLGAFYASKTILSGISRLRIKESDRVAAVCNMLEACGIRAVADENSMTIYGIDLANVPEKISLTSSNDHRMAMTCVMLAAGLGRDIEIDDISCLNKSFPAMKEIIEREMCV